MTLTKLATKLAILKSKAVQGEDVGASIRAAEKALDVELDKLYEDWPKPEEVGDGEAAVDN